MRKTVAALVLTMVAALGTFVPSVSAATISNAKVVIIVGPTGSQTASFRSSADSIYQVATRYSSNVKKVYSPNAPWWKVKAAISGANIVVYLGHGNGYPSPYATSPRPTTQNGFGLNDAANLSDNRHVYYGEQYIDDVKLAPNAVVLLNRLCYASGAGEPGHPNPTVSTARARVDNFAAGFIRAGARAVIADGHRSVGSYIERLFTTSQTIDQLWRTTNQYGHVRTFASSRSSGFTGYTDPKYVDRDYYRSMVAKPNLTTREITGVVGDTGVDPATFAVPGRASVKPEGAELLDATGATAGTLPADTRLKVVSRPTWTTAALEPVLEVSTFDEAPMTGFVRESQLVPRDNMAPVLLAVDGLPATFSPNDNDAYETTDLSARFSESVDWTLRVQAADKTTVMSTSGTGQEPSVTWDGRRDGEPLADGVYTYTFTGQDAWLNAPTPVLKSGTVRIDTTPPVLSTTAALADTLPWFAPNGDTTRETFTIKGSINEAGRIDVGIRNANGEFVRGFSTNVAAGSVSVTWDGRTGPGSIVPDGTYSIRLIPVDAYGNAGAKSESSVNVIALLGSVRTAKALIYPQDGDALASSTTLAFDLTRPATVTWTLRNAVTGAVVDTLLEGAALEAGSHRRTFNGRRTDGSLLPVGKYTSHVVATDGTFTVAQATPIETNAFSMKSSTATPRRGYKVTITAVTAEPLSSNVGLNIKQPGKSSWTVRMTKVATNTYRATVTLKTGGSAGKVTFRVAATDSKGGYNRTYLALPLR